jgi:hypothetical protein
LYEGAITDVLEVSWDVRDPDTGAPVAGSVQLHVSAMSAAGEETVTVLPLSIAVIQQDTLPHPAQPRDTARVWQRPPEWRSFATLAAGILSGAAAVGLPSIVAHDGKGAPIRFAIGGTLGVAGVLGFLRQREEVADPIAIEENRLRREAWRDAVERTIGENDGRREVHLRIVAGDVTGGRDP